MDEIIFHSAKLECNVKQAFEMFTVSENLEKWLTIVADVEPRVGGKYELFWDPKDRENDSTLGCKVLIIQPDKFLCFEWKGPKQYKRFMNERRPLTNVVVFFISHGEATEVYLLHTGWGNTEGWEEARQWFDKAWAAAFSELQKYVNKK